MSLFKRAKKTTRIILRNNKAKYLLQISRDIAVNTVSS
jgi:hypothetical protein